MADPEGQERPLLQPVLALRKEPVPTQAPGGGAGIKGIVLERLRAQRSALAGQIEEILNRRRRPPAHAGRIHLIARMFEDSFAPTWTPRGLFDPKYGTQLISPAIGGYLVEASVAKLAEFADFIRSTNSIEARVAISRVREVAAFDVRTLLHGQSLGTIWNDAAELDGRRAFVLWLAPYADSAARASVLSTLTNLSEREVLLPSYPMTVTTLLPSDETPRARPLIIRRQTSLARAMRRYRAVGAGRSVVTVSSRAALTRIAASGVSVRIDPVRRFEVTAPGVGPEPRPSVPDMSDLPVVGVVDGGLTAQTYFPMEAWRAPPLIANGIADHVHGNRITSLLVHAHAWNNRLPLPQLHCRVGTVQAIPRASSNFSPSPEQLVEYMRRVMRANPTVKVWNMSFNEVSPEDNPNLVSYLGHEIALLARELDILPVISIGNRRSNGSGQLCAPADCEAGLSVSGREFDDQFRPAGPCAVSLSGPGPDGMLKPDVSWFSRLRMIGGTPRVGSSYATTLVSSLASHTFANLKEPTSDLVKALIINVSERETHDVRLGWGTPFDEHLPWTCRPGSVTLVWRGHLRPGFNYYWNDIPIPPELIQSGKLLGTGKLTAVLKPMLSPQGAANYFSTRVQVALQYRRRTGQWNGLLGSMRESELAEVDARATLAKWHPIRNLCRDFSKSGLSFSGSTFRLYARVFSRDLFQYDGIASHHEIGEQEVSFVLTLSDGTADTAIYNSTAQMLGNFVESAVVDQEIEVNQESDIDD